jgi:peptide chain release factor subunit 1
VDPESGVELEVVDRMQLVEYFAESYKQWGTNLEFITDRSQEGSQYVKGFGGIGGILRWKVDFEMADESNFDYDDDFFEAF